MHVYIIDAVTYTHDIESNALKISKIFAISIWLFLVLRDKRPFNEKTLSRFS